MLEVVNSDLIIIHCTGRVGFLHTLCEEWILVFGSVLIQTSFPVCPPLRMDLKVLPEITESCLYCIAEFSQKGQSFKGASMTQGQGM